MLRRFVQLVTLASAVLYLSVGYTGAQEGRAGPVRFVGGTVGSESNESLYDAYSLMMDRLYQWVPTLNGPQLRPLVAEAMPEYSKDGLTATVRLRKNFKFRAGKGIEHRADLPLNANDVVVSLKAPAKPNDGRPGLALALADLIEGYADYLASASARKTWTAGDLSFRIKGIEVTDAHTLTFRLTRHSKALPLLLAHPGAFIVPAELGKAGVESDLSDAIAFGTGPWLIDVQRGDATGRGRAVEVNEVYGGEPSTRQELEISTLSAWTDARDLANEWRASELDYVRAGGRLAGMLNLKDFGEAARVFPTETLYYLAFNMESTTWGTLDEDGRGLRNAVRHAIDSADLAKTLQRSGGVLPADEPVPHLRGFEALSDAKQWAPGGLEEARTALKATKYAQGKDPANGGALALRVLCADSQISQVFGRGLSARLGELSLRADIEVAKSDQDFLDRLAAGDYDAVYYGWQNDWPDYGNMLGRLHSRHAECDVRQRVPCRLKHKDLDALIDTADNVDPVDRKARIAAWTKVADWAAKERPYIPVLCPMEVHLVSGRVELPELPWSTANTIRFLGAKK